MCKKCRAFYVFSICLFCSVQVCVVPETETPDCTVGSRTKVTSSVIAAENIYRQIQAGHLTNYSEEIQCMLADLTFPILARRADSIRVAKNRTDKN